MNAPSQSARPGIGLVVLLLLLLCLWGLSWPLLGGHLPLHPYDGRAVQTLSWAEGKYYLAVLLLEAVMLIAAVRLVAARWSARLDQQIVTLLERPTRAYAAIAVIGAVMALNVGMLVVGHRSLTEDEATYLFQARLLLSGHLSAHVPLQAYAFHQPFFYLVSIDQWSGYYQWAHPALLAIGLVVGSPWLTSIFMLALTVFFSGKAAEEYSGEARAGVVAALVVALSPLAVLTAGTIHNSNPAAACAAIALWGFARLNKRMDLGAVLAVGLSTAIGMHVRPLDQFALVAGSTALLFVEHRREAVRLALRLAPAGAIAVLGIVVHVLIHRVLQGHWEHGSMTVPVGAFGFGKAVVGVVHTPANAASLLLTDLAHVMFYLTGTPWVLLLLAFPALRLVPGKKYVAPATLVVLYSSGYFLFGGWSVLHTGPVYYNALVPVLAALVAMAAVDAHGSLKRWAPTRRVVPGFLVVQVAASIVFFWPTQALEVARASQAAHRCEELTERSQLNRALVFVMEGNEAHDSWVHQAPLPGPGFDDPILYARFPHYLPQDEESPLRFARWVAAEFGRDRETFLALCLKTSKPALARYDLKTGKIEEISAPSDMQTETHRSWLDKNIPAGPWTPLPDEVRERILREIR
ncbi:MAG: glycosyltransferase family 39 protein [Deltaproteobacteria bacterium]|nr:glycosyltransferase family 39 protein [Deltaproteobacteria bacterium]